VTNIIAWGEPYEVGKLPSATKKESSFLFQIMSIVSIAKSPTGTVKTQTNHLFSSILAYIKLKKLIYANKMNHFVIKTKICQQALKAVFKELAILKQTACA
jgi:hypothetical protein